MENINLDKEKQNLRYFEITLRGLQSLRQVLLDETNLESNFNKHILIPEWIENLDIAHGFAAKLYQVLIIVRNEYQKKLEGLEKIKNEHR